MNLHKRKKRKKIKIIEIMSCCEMKILRNKLKCKSSHRKNSIEKIRNLNSSLYHIQIVLFACVALALADVSELDTVVRFDSVVNPDSYNYAYETSKGIQAEESGVLKNAGSEQEAIVSLIKNLMKT